MATKNSGYKWGDWAVLVNGVGVNSGATTESAAVDLDGKAACEVAIAAVHSAHAFTDALCGLCYIERDADGTNYEAAPGYCESIAIPPVNNGTKYKGFAVDPKSLRLFKLLLACPTLSGASITFTVRVRTATFQTT